MAPKGRDGEEDEEGTVFRLCFDGGAGVTVANHQRKAPWRKIVTY